MGPFRAVSWLQIVLQTTICLRNLKSENMRQPWRNQFKESILYSEVLGKETETMTLIRTTKQSSEFFSLELMFSCTFFHNWSFLFHIFLAIDAFLYISFSQFMTNKIQPGYCFLLKETSPRRAGIVRKKRMKTKMTRSLNITACGEECWRWGLREWKMLTMVNSTIKW